MRVPWADLVLFAAIAIVLAVWWLHSPESPETAQSGQAGQQTSKTPTAALVAALELDDPTSTPQPTLTSTPTAAIVPQETPDPILLTPAGPIRHTIKKGDTLIEIAALYGSNVNDILQANSLSAKAVLSIGQELLIPVPGGSGGAGPTATPGPTGLMVTVKEGDTVSGLAERHKSRVDWIVKANDLQPGETLHIGRGLMIPLTDETPTPTPTVPATPIPNTPTATPGFLAPELLTPGDEAIISGEDSVLLSWTSVGVLASDEWYVVTLRSPKQETPIVTWWTKSTSWRLPAEYRPTSSVGVDYTWRVQVRRGEVQQSGEGVSPVSAGRRFTWQ